MHKYDVAIIGASLAGSSLALHLSKLGISAALVDSASFPRRKACGEGLSILGIRELEALGVNVSGAQFPVCPFYGFQFIEGGASTELHLPNLDDIRFHGVGVQRYFLDDLLIGQFRATGSGDLYLGAKVNIVEQSDRFLIQNGAGEFESKFLVFATGAQSKLPQDFGVPTEVTSSNRCGVRVDISVPHLPLGDREAVKIFIDDDFEVVCTRVAPTRINLSMMTSGAPARHFRSSNLPRLVDRLNEKFGIAGDICDEPIGVSGIGKYRRASSARNIFLVGDAVVQLDPIGGMGMTHALSSSRITAHTLNSLLRAPRENRSEIRNAHIASLKSAQRRFKAHTYLSYSSLVNPVSRTVIGKLKTSRLAQEVLMSVHRPSSWISPTGVASRLLLTCAGIIWNL